VRQAGARRSSGVPDNATLSIEQAQRGYARRVYPPLATLMAGPIQQNEVLAVKDLDAGVRPLGVNSREVRADRSAKETGERGCNKG
jgi:hypothetical protein